MTTAQASKQTSKQTSEQASEQVGKTKPSLKESDYTGEESETGCTKSPAARGREKGCLYQDAPGGVAEAQKAVEKPKGQPREHVPGDVEEAGGRGGGLAS